MADLATVDHVRAVQYLRISTDHRRYAIENQSRRIAEFAAQQGYDIIQTYTDDGRSGLTLRQRPGLNRLLRDVTDPERRFSVILVLDVSRWGRFQNADEHAAYEFLCRQLGVAVQYVAEPFANDGSFEASMMKHMKRIMAGEYSRDLSARISFGQVSSARRGFKQGGPNVFGLRRWLVDAAGKPKQELGDGQWKSLADDKVVFVPGPADEQEAVRRIFGMCLGGASLTSIARYLNGAGIVSTQGTPWSRGKVRTALKNELYTGVYVFNRTSGKLKTSRVQNPPELWVRVPICQDIIDQDTFKRAQAILAKPRTGKGKSYSAEKMLEGLRVVWKAHGRLSGDLIDAAPDVPHSGTYTRKFGSLREAYARIGYRLRPKVPAANGFTQRPRGGKPYTDAELLAQLRRALMEYNYLDGAVLARCNYAAAINTYVKAFGSMNEACRRVGYKGWPSRPARKIRYEKEAALDGLRRLFEVHGYVNTTLLNGAQSLPSSTWFRVHFGTLAGACEMAGIGGPAPTPIRKSTVFVRRQYLEECEGGAAPVHGHLRQMSDEHLMAAAQRIYAAYGFINRELIENDAEMPSVYGILKRYASLAHFYAAAGLPSVMSCPRPKAKEAAPT